MDQAVFGAQGADWNQEIFSLVRGLRRVLVENGVPPESETQHARTDPAEASS